MTDKDISVLLDQADEEFEGLSIELDEVDLSLQHLQDEFAYAIEDISKTVDYVLEHLEKIDTLLNRIRHPDRPF